MGCDLLLFICACLLSYLLTLLSFFFGKRHVCTQGIGAAATAVATAAAAARRSSHQGKKSACEKGLARPCDSCHHPPAKPGCREGLFPRQGPQPCHGRHQHHGAVFSTRPSGVWTAPAAGGVGPGGDERSEKRRRGQEGTSRTPHRADFPSGDGGRGMPRDVFWVVLDLLMPFWDPLRCKGPRPAERGQSETE